MGVEVDWGSSGVLAKLHKWYHVRKQPLGFKNNWAGSVSLSWIWLPDLLSLRVRPIFLGGLESQFKRTQFLIATLHNSLESLGMLFFLSRQQGAACKSWTNIYLNEKPKQDRCFTLCLKCGCFQHSFLKWTRNRKTKKMTAFAWQLQIRLKQALISHSTIPYPAFSGELNYWCMRKCLVFMLPDVFIFVNLWKISCHCIFTLILGIPWGQS